MSETTLTGRAETSTPAGTSAARRRERAIVTGSAAAAALVLWAVAAVGSDTELQALRQGDVHVVGPGGAFGTATVAALAGWALLATLERFTARAQTIWTGVAIVALLASLGGPLSGGIGTGSKVVLTVMHLVVGGIVIVGLRRTTH